MTTQQDDLIQHVEDAAACTGNIDTALTFLALRTDKVPKPVLDELKTIRRNQQQLATILKTIRQKVKKRG